MRNLGIVKVVFVFVAFFMIDTRLGRRRTLILGSIFMMVAFFVLAGMILGIERDSAAAPDGELGHVGAKGYVAMVMIYLFAVG